MKLFEDEKKKYIRFDEIVNYDKTKNEEFFNEIELLFYDIRDKKGNPMDPISKQSIRMMNHTHKKDLPYDYAYRGPVKAGDVKLFIDKKNGNRQVIQIAYTPAKITHYENWIKSRAIEQLPSGFRMFEKVVHVEEVIFGFKFLSTHSNKIKEQFNKGIVKFKHTKPDLIENLNKPLWDALEGIVLKNDSHIGSAQKMAKIYAPVSFIYLKLRGF